MARFDHLIFVCTNGRDPDNPKGDCRRTGGEALLDRMKALVKERGLKGKVRVTRSGCLDMCAKGCAVVAFSRGEPGDETWYTRVEPGEAEALFESHVMRSEIYQPRVDGAGRGRSRS